MYFDEANFSISGVVSYAWQRRGERTEIQISGGHRNSIQVMGFMSKKGEVKSYVQRSTVKGSSVVASIHDFARTLRGTTVLVLDNASPHTCREVLEHIEKWAERGLILYNLPPYSPELNAIETSLAQTETSVHSTNGLGDDRQTGAVTPHIAKEAGDCPSARANACSLAERLMGSCLNPRDTLLLAPSREVGRLKWTISRRDRVIADVTRLGLPEVVVQSSQLHRLLVMLEWFDGDLNMTVEQAINDISAMPPSDQLRVVQAIWDRLPDGVGTELSDLQRAELDRRWLSTGKSINRP